MHTPAVCISLLYLKTAGSALVPVVPWTCSQHTPISLLTSRCASWHEFSLTWCVADPAVVCGMLQRIMHVFVDHHTIAEGTQDGMQPKHADRWSIWKSREGFSCRCVLQLQLPWQSSMQHVVQHTGIVCWGRRCCAQNWNRR